MIFPNFFVFVIVILLSADAKKIWTKADLPQFRPKKPVEEPIPTGPRNRIVEWKNNLKFQEVSPKNNVFCRIFGLCAHYSTGVVVLSMLSKWKDRGMIYPYKKYDGTPDSNLPMTDLHNFVKTLHNKPKNN
ncbi:Secretory peptide [Caenorhabditis elegans]|uniref:Secretory peptide n=1 Tax=Caenorhabditis elegans TaxID=6239 RepID=A0A1X7RBM4_CAEEL|nr:Secretory peptide [Caenorhabditis elegans]SMQ11476.1 Secretory peptide [Caenorhabditis elegans]|eukprot:NP_499699.3 Uncharacterized protein CELE_ZK1010.12 [Caenorhabditis elegans]